MDLFEHQAKRLLTDYGITMPAGETARSADGAGQARDRHGLAPLVAQRPSASRRRWWRRPPLRALAAVLRGNFEGARNGDR